MLTPDETVALADIERRLANVVRLGVVAGVDHMAARCRVQYDADEAGAPVLTGWLPWVAPRAAGDRAWWTPEAGEQVVLLAPSGELTQAVVLPSLYRETFPAPADAPTVHRTVYADGAVVEYDRAAHRLRAALPAGATTELVSPGGVAVTGNLAVTGDVAITGDLAVTGDVSDGAGSMQEMRDTYNPHTHPPGSSLPLGRME